MTHPNIQQRLDRIEDKMDDQFARVFKELSHLRGKLYFGAGCISVAVSVLIAYLRGWL